MFRLFGAARLFFFGEVQRRYVRGFCRCGLRVFFSALSRCLFDRLLSYSCVTVLFRFEGTFSVFTVFTLNR